MSRAPGEGSGPLASLPRYQSAAAPERSADSVWPLLVTPGSGLDPHAVAAFLRHLLAPPESLFSGVLRLPAPLPVTARGHAPMRALERLTGVLLTAWVDTVRDHLAAGARDVSLSGGLDSAALCAMAAQYAPSQVRAWTMDVHFADETERRNAGLVARTAGVPLVELSIPDAVLPDLFELAVLANETAIINARAVASFAFYAEARKQGATVMLSGAGADEVLMGNPGALAGARARVAEDRALADRVLRAPGPGEWKDSWEEPHAPGATEELRYAAWVLRELVLPPELRGALAHGITLRTPYLDSRFADVALGLPADLLLREETGKWLFRHALRSLVPKEVRFARKMPRYALTALSSPVRERWLELYRAWLSPARLQPLECVDPSATLALLDQYVRLAPEDSQASAMDRLLMRLVSLAMLHARAEAPPPCPES
ncbi:asparagine synthase C-terminal domain-containing protein [Hyalangium rubrum]|uniref:asparagine synthase (glutamine-hydrolyzing) n=1 Tax=Hyalangium rubrum TaxID=3103134 RepID=A0ABU5HI32_9BACT|nr:asparagine synthase C-terminal domain-containing protein [Hyalangium sp. s54d21]MDY7232467.1 asparagine synthase C-terminal domain-containing protein [Hyalangium sp. s54d21]